MKKLIFILPLILFSQLSSAETAAERAELYFKDISEFKFKQAANHFDAEQLKEFRKLMEFYKEIPEDSQAQFIQSLFGEEHSRESIEALTDVEFFASLLTLIMQQAKAIGGLNFDRLEILGEVREGENIAHLVTRNKISVGELEMESMEIVSLKKNGEQWRVMMSGKIKGLPQQLKAAFTDQ